MSKKEQLEHFWACQRQRIASEMGDSRNARLAIEDRVTVLRLMSAEAMATMRNLSDLATEMVKFHALLTQAIEVAREIVRLDEMNTLAPLSAEPIQVDARAWLRALEQAAHSSERAGTHLQRVAPDIIERIGTLAVDDPKPRGKTKA